MRKKHSLKIGIIILMSLILGYADLSPAFKQNIWPFETGKENILNTADLNLGLDLQGGAQLEYKIDLRDVEPTKHDAAIDNMIKKFDERISSLTSSGEGITSKISEPNIYETKVGNERHITIELAGIKDIDQAKEQIGKIVQLEFKEPKTEAEINDPEASKKLAEQAQALLAKTQEPEAKFNAIGVEEKLTNPELTIFQEENKGKALNQPTITFKGRIPVLTPGLNEEVINKLKTYEPGTIHPEVITENGFHQIIKINEVNEVDVERKFDKDQAEVRHILISHAGATRADESITRTEEEAKARAEEVLNKINANGDFNALASEYSDGPSKNDGGKLPQPVIADTPGYDPTFSEAALKLNTGEVSPITKTEFGFHIIKADKTNKANSTITEKEAQFKFARILISAQPSRWKSTALTGKMLKSANMVFPQGGITPRVQLTFNSEGAKLFGEISTRNIQQPVAIFVDGAVISEPVIQSPITDGVAVITSNFTIETAKQLAQDIETGILPAKPILVGQKTISSTLGDEALSTSLKAGLIGLLLVALYMIAYYRLPGLIAVIALAIYSIILLFLIKIELPVPLALLISLGIFIWMVIAIINSKDQGLEKTISLTVATFGLFFMTFLLSNKIVLTLAGVAGVILSIGMAVDANILIFERMKEELKNGSSFNSALTTGFARAWSSIRDSNFSSLITCAILFLFGTSIIRGFAFNLAAGIVVSMLTAITITRTFLAAFENKNISNNKAMFGIKDNQQTPKNLKIIENNRTWFGISGVMVTISLIALATFGLRLGIDFTGGTMMEVKFANPVEKEQLKNTIIEIEKELQETNKPTAFQLIPTAQAQDTNKEPEPENNENKTAISPNATEHIEFGTPVVIDTENSQIIKLKHLSKESHDQLRTKLTEKLGAFEEVTFNTIGPTIGNSMKTWAYIALAIALAAIILYIALAFRKIPKHLNPWRFGACAIIALAHDIIIVTGIFAILGHYIPTVEIDALFITALLTILGFSVHDTIVVFDRLRENIRIKGSNESFTTITNESLTQTMARSINTSLSTLITLLALYFLGSESIQWFVLALILGTLVGTYSSIFTASPILVAWSNLQNKKKTKK